MKYLVTAKPGATPVPPAQGAALLSASLQWLQARISEGKLDCVYNFFGGGGFAVGNYNSHEEALKFLLDYPLYPFFVWEVEPILDANQSGQMYIEFYKKMGGG